MKKLNILLLPFIFTTSCAVGPLMFHETARTVGDSNHELVGGAGQAGLLFKWNYGLSENLDLGIQFESLSLGLRAKYAFINSGENGFSLASGAGIGFSVGGSHYYGDLIGSYFFEKWEPYTGLRLVHAKNDDREIKSSNSALDFTIEETQYNYGQITLGTKFWFSKSWVLSAEASSIFSKSSGFLVNSNVFAGLALGYKF